MKERKIREFLDVQREKDPVRLALIEQRVNHGLETNRDALFNQSSSQSKQILSVISNVMYETTEILGIGLPNVGLIYDWDDKDEARRFSRVCALTGEGVIRYSPDYLRLILKGLIKKGNDSKADINHLVNTTAHEVFHFYQEERFPNSFNIDSKRDLKIYNFAMKYDYDLTKLPRSRSERGAEIFSKHVEKGRNKKRKLVN